MVEQNLISFEGKNVRKIWHNDEWYFSVVDIIEVLTDSHSPRAYLTKFKQHTAHLSENYVKLKLQASDGKHFVSDCANTEGVFRIIMSIPSPKAEPFKLWLAGLDKSIITEDMDKMSEKSKKLTEIWHERGVTDAGEQSILAATIFKETFGLSPSEHHKLQGFDYPDLLNQMKPLDLIFYTLAEEATRTYAENTNAQGFDENLKTAQQGGKIAYDARLRVENQAHTTSVNIEGSPY